jgi:hypothetical protein
MRDGPVGRVGRQMGSAIMVRDRVRWTGPYNRARLISTLRVGRRVAICDTMTRLTCEISPWDTSGVPLQRLRDTPVKLLRTQSYVKVTCTVPPAFHHHLYNFPTGEERQVTRMSRRVCIVGVSAGFLEIKAHASPVTHLAALIRPRHCAVLRGVLDVPGWVAAPRRRWGTQVARGDDAVMAPLRPPQRAAGREHSVPLSTGLRPPTARWPGTRKRGGRGSASVRER